MEIESLANISLAKQIIIRMWILLSIESAEGRVPALQRISGAGNQSEYPVCGYYIL